MAREQQAPVSTQSCMAWLLSTKILEGPQLCLGLKYSCCSGGNWGWAVAFSVHAWSAASWRNWWVMARFECGGWAQTNVDPKGSPSWRGDSHWNNLSGVHCPSLKVSDQGGMCPCMMCHHLWWFRCRFGTPFCGFSCAGDQARWWNLSNEWSHLGLKYPSQIGIFSNPCFSRNIMFL